MDYRYLGRSGLKVSELCLGAMTFGRETDAGTSHTMLDRFLEGGGNFIDSSDMYSYPTGSSEEILGRWLETQRRDELVVATKVRWATGPGANEAGLSRKHVFDALETSLRRLRTDYVDLYYIHGWDPGTGFDEILATFDSLVRSGKVRYLGISNWAAWQVQKAVDLAAAKGLEPFIALQPLYNLLDREIEREHVPVCLNEGLGMLPWSPLRGGWLSGKYHREMTAPPADTRIDQAEREGWRENWTNYATERTWTILDELNAVAEASGKTAAQVAINWLLGRPGVVAPIIGACDMTQLDSNLGAAGWRLDDAQQARLTAATELPVLYPYNFLDDAARRR
jgi:aryl-alcohol dehydrogenase-like predicted oxidoreductase